MTTQTTVDYKRFHEVLYKYGVNFQYPIDTEKFIKEVSPEAIVKPWLK